MSIKKLVVCLLFVFCSVYASDDVYPDVKALASAISVDYSGNVQRAQERVTIMQTDKATVDVLRPEAEKFEEIAKKAFEKIQRTIEQKGAKFFNEAKSRVQSFPEDLTYEKWLKEQNEKLIRLHDNIGAAGRTRGTSSVAGQLSPRTTGGPYYGPPPVSPRPVAVGGDSMSPRSRRVTGEGAEGIRMPQTRPRGVVSATSTPVGGGSTKTQVFGGLGMPPKSPVTPAAKK